MRYTINRFQSVELPTFNPDWQALCKRCVNMTTIGPGLPSDRQVMRCRAAKKALHGTPTCSEVRHTECGNGELFRERVV